MIDAGWRQAAEPAAAARPNAAPADAPGSTLPEEMEQVLRRKCPHRTELALERAFHVPMLPLYDRVLSVTVKNFFVGERWTDQRAADISPVVAYSAAGSRGLAMVPRQPAGLAVSWSTWRRSSVK